MPNRIIKESICTSEKIAELTDFEFRVWVGLITQADDCGRADARPAIIKGRVFPLRDCVTNRNISDALRKLESTGLIALYEVGGRPYLCFPRWNVHQRVRDSKPKFPGPDEADCHTAESCGELRRVAASCGLNPIQSESNPVVHARTREELGDEPEPDVGWLRVIAAYEANIGLLPTGKAFENLLSYYGDLGADVMAYAIELTNVAQPDRPKPYLAKLLASWAERGINTLQKAQADSAEHKRRTQPRQQREDDRPEIRPEQWLG